MDIIFDDSEVIVKAIDALILRTIPGVGDKTINKILKFAIENKISTLDELSRIENLSKKLNIEKVEQFLKDPLRVEQAKTKVNNELEIWEKMGIVTVVLGSDYYPKQLLDLDAPPPFLFCKGNVKLLKNTLSIAVVGTRNNTKKGELITRKTIDAFAKSHFVIVSGLAVGIDAIAHQSAIDASTPTIAVLVDLINVAPASNRNLAEKIIESGGLLIAENNPGTPIVPAFFAKRDRIQAGLSTAVLAVETSENGGTMHAVNTAISINRTVFVPDPIAAGYPDEQIDVISGIRKLIVEKKAIPYTRDTYATIIDQLEKVAERFSIGMPEGFLL